MSDVDWLEYARWNVQAAGDPALQTGTPPDDLGLCRALIAKHEECERMRLVVEAAVAYGKSHHTGDANCRAGDCDACSARPALAAFELAIITYRSPRQGGGEGT